ncbi:MAG TPA: RHS repeat-associated core domain-containing protein [Terracidiphilus sp.]|nr:RHS repeat-associated core domain-containing protein [Terracidiphilus sp.]
MRCICFVSAKAAGTLSRSYDQFGNLLTNARTTSAGTLTTSYTYDAANRIASITYPSQTVVSYTRDIMGRITAVTAKPSGGASTPVASNVAYEPFGPSSGLTYVNGVAETRGFDQDYRMTGVTDTGNSVLQNLGYVYYPTNNVQTITDAVNSGNSQSFSYDNLQRLSSAAGGYGSFTYTYDKDGNRLTQTHGTETTNYGYGTANDLLATLSVGGTQTQAVGYSADGRIASLNPGIQAPGGQYITSLSYNQDAQLSAVNAAGGALASYTYDAFGQRLIKTISGTTGDIYQYGQNGMLMEETNASGAAQADYIYLNGRPIATLNNSTGTLYFLHDDMLGTPQVATDGSQTVAWQATYQPFGTASVSGTITQNLRFPGQYFDAESGWNHNGFRDYIPDLGRYAEPDPLGRLGSGNNLYAYVNDDPTGLTDLFGLCPKQDPCESSTSSAQQQRIGPISGYPETGKHAWRAANDPIFIYAVNQFNQSNSFVPGSPMYVTPMQLKAQAMVESGGTPSAFASDPLQANNAGDWTALKGRVTGLKKGQSMTPCISATAALKWLLYKGSIHDINGNVVGYRSMYDALRDYNGNMQIYPHEGGMQHRYWYASKVLSLSQ